MLIGISASQCLSQLTQYTSILLYPTKIAINKRNISYGPRIPKAIELWILFEILLDFAVFSKSIPYNPKCLCIILAVPYIRAQHLVSKHILG